MLVLQELSKIPTLLCLQMRKIVCPLHHQDQPKQWRLWEGNVSFALHIIYFAWLSFARRCVKAMWLWCCWFKRQPCEALSYLPQILQEESTKPGSCESGRQRCRTGKPRQSTYRESSVFSNRNLITCLIFSIMDRKNLQSRLAGPPCFVEATNTQKDLKMLWWMPLSVITL